MARILDVAHRMALQGHVGEQRGGPWEPALIIAGCDKAFALHGGPASARNVIDFLSFAPDNPSSIFACLKAARENARAMRAQITRSEEPTSELQSPMRSSYAVSSLTKKK